MKLSEASMHFRVNSLTVSRVGRHSILHPRLVNVAQYNNIGHFPKEKGVNYERCIENNVWEKAILYA